MKAVTAVYRESFVDVPVRRHLRHGLTLAEIVQIMPTGAGFVDEGFVTVGNAVIPSGVWHLCRPHAGTVVGLHRPAAGGGSDGAKSIAALVASLALTVAGGWIIGGGLATAGGWFTAGSLSATALAGTVSLVGSLAISALIPPPVLSADGTGAAQSLSEGSAAGNVLEPNVSVVRVIGERKVFPPFAAEPLIYFDGEDEVVEAVYVLAGPHRINDVRIGSTPLADADVTSEIREGFSSDAALSLVTRQGRTENVGIEVRGHLVEDSDQRTVQAGSVAPALPLRHVVTTRDSPDEHQLQLTLPQGLFKTSAAGTVFRVPFRLRVRKRGGAWRNLPELHYAASATSPRRLTVKLQWSASAITPFAPSGEGWVEARRSSPGQTVAPTSTTYNADSYFGSAGTTYLDNSNYGASGVAKVRLDRYTATIRLDPASFPPGVYDVEIMRGAVFQASNYAPGAYTYSGVIWNFWTYQGTPNLIVMARTDMVDAVQLLRSVSIWNSTPLPTKDFASIQIKAVNRSIEALSCLAGGYVKDWNGTTWTTPWVVTSNPAPHYRDVLTGAMNQNPLPVANIDNDNLVAWRTRCASMGYECNALIAGQTVDDVKKIVASCGYAVPRQSDLWGVAMDYDRNAEEPVQIFTPQNSRAYHWTKAFATVPDALRVSFDNSATDYEPDQVVYPAGTPDTDNIEQVTYVGFTNDAKVEDRVTYDIEQLKYRSAFHIFECGAQSIVAQKGDMVGLQHDVLTTTSGFGMVVEYTLNTLNLVTAVYLDNELPYVAGVAGLAIALNDGSVVVLSGGRNADDFHRFDLTTPTSVPQIEVGQIASYGEIGNEYLRLIVFEVRPGADYTATVTAVDEAPELWT